MRGGASTGPWRSASFSFIEVLLVVMVLLLMLSMISFLPSAARRDADVHAAAQELAATLREARTLAIRRRTLHAVVFNIQDAPGTSGLVLNNWSGGHWYRILGPWEHDDTNVSDPPPLPWPSLFNGGNLSMVGFLHGMESSWIGAKHALPAHRVRFLALSDQDDGGYIQPGNTTSGDNRSIYPPTYPRPWCGWWDPGSSRLYAWGGYDHTISNPFRPHNETGFWYEGADGAISGSVNPASRSAGSCNVLTQGDGRPLVDAAWADYWILFYPDGTVAEGPSMAARKWSYFCGAQAGPGGSVLGDRWEDIGSAAGDGAGGLGSPMTSFAPYTGYWYLTLAADAGSDSQTFTSPVDAMDSMLPAYRVGINSIGVVTVLPVVRSGSPPAGLAYDTAITNWSDPTQTSTLYATNARTLNGAAYGTPVSSFISPMMLQDRVWWMVPAP